MRRIEIYNEDTGELLLEFDAAAVVVRGDALVIEIKPKSQPTQSPLKLRVCMGGPLIDVDKTLYTECLFLGTGDALSEIYRLLSTKVTTEIYEDGIAFISFDCLGVGCLLPLESD